MAEWYIGIDESGCFDSYNLKKDRSYVCAVVTQKSEDECASFLVNCARELDETKYQTITQGEEEKRIPAVVVKNFYHGMEYTIEELTPVLNHLVSHGSDFFGNVFCSKRDSFVGSVQHYYMTALQNVLSAIYESGLFKKGDEVQIYVAERVPDVIGNAMSTDLVIARMNDALENEQKKENPDKSLIEQIRHAEYYVMKYGSLHKRKDAKVPEISYADLLAADRERIELSVDSFVRATYPWCKTTVKCCSAKKFALPALADQAINAINYKEYLNPEAYIRDVVIAKSHKFVRGENVSAYIEEGDYVSAINVWLDLFYENTVVNYFTLQDIFKKCQVLDRDELWSIVIEYCRDKMNMRGNDGEVIKKTQMLVEQLNGLINKYKPSNRVVLDYLRMKDVFAAHDGTNSLNEVERTLVEIKNLRDFSDKYADYQEYCQLYIDEMIGSVAQVRFNNYNFADDDYRTLLNSYRTRFDKEPYFYNRHKNFKDDNYSKILGTLGQALLFRGDAKEAVSYLELDYMHSSEKLEYPASYLVIAYLNMGDLENAEHWLKQQAKQILDDSREWSLAEIGENLEKDLWLTLNYLRLYAYSQKQGSLKDIPFPSYDLWARDENAGDYPWALLLKWGALVYLQAEREDRQTMAKMLLDKAVNAMKNSKGFTIQTLLLPILKMQSILNGYPEKSCFLYKTLYQTLLGESTFFREFAATRPVLRPDDRSTDLWLVATALPFNYS